KVPKEHHIHQPCVHRPVKGIRFPRERPRTSAPCRTLRSAFGRRSFGDRTARKSLRQRRPGTFGGGRTPHTRRKRTPLYFGGSRTNEQYDRRQRRRRRNTRHSAVNTSQPYEKTRPSLTRENAVIRV